MCYHAYVTTLVHQWTNRTCPTTALDRPFGWQLFAMSETLVLVAICFGHSLRTLYHLVPIWSGLFKYKEVVCEYVAAESTIATRDTRTLFQMRLADPLLPKEFTWKRVVPSHSVVTQLLAIPSYILHYRILLKMFCA